MSATAKRPATYADLLEVPEHLVAQILFGALVTHPRPAPAHATVQGAVVSELGSPYQKGSGGPGGWVFMVEPEVHLGPHVLVPDLAGWRRERLPHLPKTPYIEIAPDWVCEVLSPSTENIDRGPKRRLYAMYTVGHMWLVEPIARRLEAYVLRDHQWVLHETFDGADEVKAPPFDAVPFQISALWPLPPAPADI